MIPAHFCDSVPTFWGKTCRWFCVYSNIYINFCFSFSIFFRRKNIQNLHTLWRFIQSNICVGKSCFFMKSKTLQCFASMRASHRHIEMLSSNVVQTYYFQEILVLARNISLRELSGLARIFWRICCKDLIAHFCFEWVPGEFQVLEV